MSFFFRKRLGLGPLNLNLTKSGIGLSLGVRGFRAGISSSGRRYVSAGLPGTGIAYRKFARKQPPHRDVIAPPSPASAPAVHSAHTIGYGIGYVVGWLLMLSPFAVLAWLTVQFLR